MYKVLLVDDEPAMTELERHAISTRAQGFSVAGEAYGVKQAVKMLSSLRPDVVVTDIKMPGGNGTELLRHIFEQEEPIVTVVVSGHDDFDYVHDAFMYNAFDYLLKPLDPRKIGELFEKIGRMLESRDKLERHAEPEHQSMPQSAQEALVEEIGRYVREHLGEDNGIVMICRRFAVSQPYLSKLFKKHKNCTYNEFLVDLKISEAKHLLIYAPDDLIGDVAMRAGFSDQFYFSKVFKSVTGFTPSEYRKRRGGRD